MLQNLSSFIIDALLQQIAHSQPLFTVTIGSNYVKKSFMGLGSKVVSTKNNI
jgi:hypothetical protein